MALKIKEKLGGVKVARVYNFSAGPAVLPEEVLKEAADEKIIARLNSINGVFRVRVVK